MFPKYVKSVYPFYVYIVFDDVLITLNVPNTSVSAAADRIIYNKIIFYGD